MNEMTFREVDIDEVKPRNNYSKNKDLIKNFDESGSKAVEVFGFAGKANVKAMNLTKCAKKHGYENIKGISKNGHLYLVREA